MKCLFKCAKFFVLIYMVMLHSELLAVSLDFGRVRINAQQLDTLWFKNENLITMMISKTTIRDTVFSFSSHPFTGALSQLKPGEERYMPIVFSPQDTKRISSQLILETNLGDFSWTLLGEGVKEVVVINEVLADPAAGLAGDANGDGVRDGNEDEFVELLNTGKYPINMEGWQLFDAGASQNNRLTFPLATWLNPNERVVVFGGGEPKGISGKFFVDDGRIGGGLRNSGDEILLFDPVHEDTMAFMSYGTEGNKNVSLVRWPEGVGQWYLHTEFPGNETFFSPGSARTLVVGIEISHQDTSIAFGDSLHLSVRKVWSTGSTQSAFDEDLSWHMSNDHILVREESGVWVGKQEGLVQIYSELRGFVSDTISVRILPPKVVGLNVTVGDSLLLVGNTYELLVEGVISESEKTVITDGYVVDISDSNRIRFEKGKIEARSVGMCELAVRKDGQLGRMVIRVVEMGDLNADGEHTIWDAVRIVHLILGIEPEGNVFELQSADFTRDGVLDIRDLIGVIQQIFGDEDVSHKPVAFHIGLQESPGGFSISIPPQTVAITFKVKHEHKNKDIKIANGNVYLEEKGMVFEGIMLPNSYESITWQDQKVDVFGNFNLYECEWVAWTLDGNKYLLLPQENDKRQRMVINASPNPLNPSTTIIYSIPVAQEIKLGVYNVTGQWIGDLFNGYVSEGVHKIVWDGHDEFGRSVASGLYLLHLKGAFDTATLKMVVLR